MVERFKTPVSRIIALAASVGCAGATALGSMFPAAASAGAATVPTPASSPTAAAGFSFVKSLGGIDEYRLDSNGLTVLLVPDHSAPVVPFHVDPGPGLSSNLLKSPRPRP